MKRFKKIISMTLIMVVIIGTLMVSNVGAATPKTTGLTFEGWHSNTSMYLRVQNINAEKYQYMIFTLGGTRLKTTPALDTYYYSDYGTNYKCILIAGLRTNLINGIKVRQYRNGAWGEWSNNYYIVPRTSNANVSQIGETRSMRLTWSNIAGVTQYVVQLATSPYDAWTVAKRTSGTSVTLSSYRGSSFSNYQNYYYRVLGTRSINGITYKTNYNSKSYNQGYFWFSTVYSY